MDMFGIHEKSLHLRAQRAAVISSNIFNAATPHFKARDLDVEPQLAQTLEQSGPRLTHPRHLDPQSIETPAKYRVPIRESLDGNTVDVAYEQVKFAENSVQYRATLSFLNSRITTIRRALRGE